MQHSSRTLRRAKQNERRLATNLEDVSLSIAVSDIHIMDDDSLTNTYQPELTYGRNVLLSSNSKATHLEGILLILKYIIQFKVAGDQLDALLSMINYLVPDTTLPANKNEYFKNWLYLKESFVCYDYCDACSRLYEESEDKCPICDRKRYVTTVKEGKQLRDCFIYFPMESLLRERFRDESFQKKLLLEFEQRNLAPTNENIVDISDGAIWQKLRKEYGIFGNAFDLALGINIDGGVAFASSGVQLWPIFLAINNLPASERFKEENMLMNCLWIGKGTPNMEVYLLPFIRDLERAYRIPLLIQENHVRPILLYLTADLKAKAPAMNFESCTSTHGCTVCDIRGYYQEGSMRFITATEELPLPRSHETTKSRAIRAVNSAVADTGVNGLSPLFLLPYFDIIAQCVVDPMHCICLNVSSLLWTLWISEKYASSPFSIRQHVEKINSIQRHIRIPYGRESRPRQVDDFGSWKAHEHKFWLLYLAPSILQPFLPGEYWSHLRNFSEALQMLWAPSISERAVVAVEGLLFGFVRQFSTLYPIAASTINVHYLLHLPAQVVNFGPLWTHAAFPFEHKMGAIINHVHGTNVKQSEQLLFMAVLINSQQIISDHFSEHDMHHSVFRKLKLTEPTPNARWSSRLPPGWSIVDKLKKYRCCPAENERLSGLLFTEYNDWWRFLKLRKGRQLYCASKYTFSDHQMAKRCSHYAVCRNSNGEESIQKINFFLIRETGATATIVASTNLCAVTPLFGSTLKLVHQSSTECFIFAEQIEALCVAIQVESDMFFTRVIHSRDQT